jgi:hypothetical protein
MNIRSLGIRFPMVVAGLIVAILASSALSGALADPSAEVLYACAKNGNGQLRLVAADEACNKSEHAVQWGVQGPAGPPGPSGLNVVAGIIGPDGQIVFGQPYGGADFTVARLGSGVYQVDIAQSVLPGVRCPVTVAQSGFTNAFIKVSGWVCDPTGYHVTFVTSDGSDAGFWFQVTQIQDELG